MIVSLFTYFVIENGEELKEDIDVIRLKMRDRNSTKKEWNTNILINHTSNQ